ncbi:complex I 24 kDa subunit family protein [Salinispira pacifica]|uniref:NAD-reducing hydrogenase subunit HoxE n=1 Tax=Salinispira pacifica TaxID=1307761 RepID=V5WDS1_9SPIO|nr:NAD(P)H-dependent oxidoreductase subunit E [Salinispira pacifica]AHC13714.1 NAD-reducing hydrogenase subunit HoxE [Salinispira pacifica]
MAATAETLEITPALQEFVDEWKEKPGNLIMILHKTQQEFGYIPRKIAKDLAKELEVPLAKIYGVITFYHYFKLEKPGRNIISVCMGTACYLKGGKDIIQEFENLLGVGINTTTDDGEFSLEAVRCVGCCGLAPVVTVNNEVYGKVGTEDLADIIAKHRGEADS